MLSLRVNNQTIDLGEDVSIAWELRNPMFFDKGSRSYPFHIPTTGNNIKILGFRHRIEGVNDPYQEFPCDIAFNGIDIFRGLLKFTIFNKEYYEGMVYENEGSFYYKSKNINIGEVNLGEILSANNYYGLQYINDCKNRFYPERTIAFPMILNEYYLDPPTEVDHQKFLNYQHTDGQIYEYIPGQDPGLGIRNIIIPFVYFRHVLKMVLRGLGYTDDSVHDLVFSADSTFNHLLVYNSLSCNGVCDEFPYNLDHIFPNLHLPKITVLDFITAIESYFNCRFFINDIEGTICIISLNQALNNSTAVDFSNGIISKSIELDDKITGFKLSIPIDSADDYLKEWTEAQEFYLKNLCSPVDSPAQLPAWPFAMVNNVRYVKSVNKFYRFLPDKTWFQDDWAFTALFSTELIGDSTTDRDFVLGALKNAIPTSPNWEDWFCPAGNQKKDWMDIPFKIFFTKLTTINTFPDYTAMTATDSYENLYLWFNGTNNIYEKYHKDWLDFLSTTKVVKIQRIFSLKEIRDFDFSRKYLIQGDKYFIRRIQVTFKKDRISPALMECLTVK